MDTLYALALLGLVGVCGIYAYIAVMVNKDLKENKDEEAELPFWSNPDNYEEFYTFPCGCKHPKKDADKLIREWWKSEK